MLKKQNIHRHGHQLEKELEKHLPLTAFPSPELLRDLHEHGIQIAKDRELTIDQAAYIKKAKTIYCSFYLSDYQKGNFTPIEYLQFQVEGQLAEHIQMFQHHASARDGSIKM